MTVQTAVVEHDGIPGHEGYNLLGLHHRWDWHGRQPTKVWSPAAWEDGRWCRDVLALDPCAYCGHEVECIDHIDPSAHGGANDWSNFTAACRVCNMQKSGVTLLRYLLRRPELDAKPWNVAKRAGQRECAEQRVRAAEAKQPPDLECVLPAVARLLAPDVFDRVVLSQMTPPPQLPTVGGTR